jgi:glycosyltransferase involved in cell wall biosynthesis
VTLPSPSVPSVSVVIPVLDDAVALERLLELLAAQTVAPLEVVVVDNGSADDSAAVARSYQATVAHEPVRGIPAAAARGYDAATGDVIVRCDADTIPPADWLERIVGHFEADPSLEAVTGTGWFYDVPRWRAVTQGRLYLTSYYLLMHAAMGHPPLWGSNMAVRRTSWLRVAASVHRLERDSHDDVDLSFCLGPHLRVLVDRDLRVGVSGRSLAGGPLARRRFRWAFRSLALGWADMPPWRRWELRLRGPA